MQVYTEVTLFMQKAIFYVSRLIAARGVLELTDRSLNFDVSSLDASFGIKNVSIDLSTLLDIRIEGGDMHPRIIVQCESGKYEFVLSNAQRLYDRLRALINNPLIIEEENLQNRVTLKCRCGREVNSIYRFCPWCGEKL